MVKGIDRELSRQRSEFDQANRWEQAMRSTDRGSLSWADVGAEDLKEVVAHATEDGAAVLLAKTSDGGALLVQILVSRDRRPKFYAATMAELNEMLMKLASV